MEIADRLLVGFLGWVVGIQDDPGADERNTARVRGLLCLLVLGLVVPFVTMVAGLVVGRVADSVELARGIMAIGIIPGAVVATGIGFGFAFVVDVIVRTLGNTPEDAGEFVETYAGVLAWVLVGEELCWLLAPYATVQAIVLGVLLAATIVNMMTGWNLPLTWSRTLAFRLQMVLLALVLWVAVSNFYEREYFFVHAEESAVKHARAVAAEREKAFRTAELASITARIFDPRSSVEYQEAAKRGFADKAAESAFVASEYKRARKDMARWEDRGYPRPVRWLRVAWREYIE